MVTRFMPDWVLGCTCAYITIRFVNSTIPLQAFANKYSKSLSEKYSDASSEKLVGVSQDMLYFLATFESSNHMDIVESYMFNSLNFTQRGRKRKIKTLFGSALDAKEQATTHQASIRRFKNFVFQLRAHNKYNAPEGWKLREEQGIEWLLDIYEQNVIAMDGL
jgi:hypothetical protein